MSKNWKLPERNWENIEFEELRKNLDPVFNEAHDALSAAYYEKRPFIWKGKNWGILNKKTFDELHGLIFQLRTLKFDEESRKRLKKRIVDEEVKRAQQEIDKLKRRGIELEI